LSGSRKSNAARILLFICAPLACVAFTCRGGEPAPPEINWEQIEAWAAGDAVVLVPKKTPDAPKTDVKPTAPAVAKTEPPPETKPAVKLPSKVTDAKDYVEMRVKFAARASALLKVEEAERRYDRAFDIAYRAENYLKAGEMVAKIKTDKRYAGREYELWTAAKTWELGCLINLPKNLLQGFFRSWKDKSTKAIEDNLITDQGLADRLQVARDLNKVAQREAYFNSVPDVFEELRIQELKGETDWKQLWELAMRYAGDSPSVPMKYMAQLYRLRERFPDCDVVKSGEVQVCIARCLSDVLWLPQDAADEAVVAMEKFKQHGAVANGDMCWIAAENYKWHAGDLKTNKDQLEMYRKAHHYLVEMQTNHPKNGNNNPFKMSGEQIAKSQVQRRLEEVSNNIRKRE
jgi:hypothetical protein